MKTEIRYRCKEEGCNEWTFSVYDSKKEAREAFQRRSNWKCCRHSSPERVLSPQKTTNEKVYVCQRDEKLQKNFWNGSNGFVFGGSYKAYADDFPVGTKLIERSEIILPA